MDDRRLYETILGLSDPWSVVAVEVSTESEEIRVQLDLDPTARLACPACGGAESRYDRSADDPMKAVSILVPTRNRPKSLRRTLVSIDRTSPVDAEVEVVVIDNGGEVSAHGVVDSEEWSVPIEVVEATEPGKNPALNLGFRLTSSELVICLDDDVIVSENYLQEVLGGSERWPDAAAFGGDVRLEWSVEEMASDGLHEKTLEYVRGFAFGSHSIAEERPYAESESPIGNNMIFRRSSLPRREPFHAGSGPRPGRYRMGGSTSLWRELRRSGLTVVHLPNAVVRHLVREEQLSLEWILERSFSWGRSVGFHGLSFQRISGGSPRPVLYGQWIQRLVTEGVMALRNKSYPRTWAQIDRKVIEGILYERRAGRVGDSLR